MSGPGHEIIEPFIEHQGEQRGFWLRKPRAIGEKILIARKGSSVPDSPGGRQLVVLDFKSAFGTGGHGTTEGCLIALEKQIGGGETVLDVGTGTGILAIAARKLGAGRVTAIDIDRAACIETGKNIVLNGVENGIDVIEGGIGSVRDRFDITVANLRTPVLVDLMDELAMKPKEGGIVVLSGILERELPSFMSFLACTPLETSELKRIHGWMTLVLVKRGPG